jgi:hypothetical protein
MQLIYLISSYSESSLKLSDEISPVYTPNSGLGVTDTLSTVLTLRVEMPVTSTILI